MTTRFRNIQILLVVVLRCVISFGFYSHDLISILTWNRLLPGTKEFLCESYEVCDLVDFETINALPDLMKHHEKFEKYFSLHFYNNNLDEPPKVCSLDPEMALKEEQTPNLIQAVIALLAKMKREQLSFVELSYFIHLVADLHQPFHLTAYDRGGMNKKLCCVDGKTCWSLHALWDAEILKQTSVSERNVVLLLQKEAAAEDVDVDLIADKNDTVTILKWAEEMNRFICLIYLNVDDNLSIEDYSYYTKDEALYLIDLAAKRISNLLNQYIVA